MPYAVGPAPTTTCASVPLPGVIRQASFSAKGLKRPLKTQRPVSSGSISILAEEAVSKARPTTPLAAAHAPSSLRLAVSPHSAYETKSAACAHSAIKRITPETEKCNVKERFLLYHKIYSYCEIRYI